MKTVMVDHQDLARVQLFEWLAQKDERGVWQIYTDENDQHIPLDGFILGCDTQQSIDHLDGDEFNCRRDNLEVVTIEELVERRIRRVAGVSVEEASRDPF